MKNDWFYIDGLKQKMGPVPKESIEVMLEDSILNAKTLVWSKTLYDWMPAIEVDQLNWKRPMEYAFVDNYRSNRVVIKEYSKPPACSQLEKDEANQAAVKGLASIQSVGAVIWLMVGILQVLSVSGLLIGILNIIWATAAFSVSLRLRAGDPTVKRFLSNPIIPVILLSVNIMLGSGFGTLAILIDLYVRYATATSENPEISTSHVAFETV